MKNTLGGQFHFFLAGRGGPTRGPVRPLSEVLNVQVVPRSVLRSESSNGENRAKHSLMSRLAIWFGIDIRKRPRNLRSRHGGPSIFAKPSST